MTASPIENFKLPELTGLNDVFSKVKTALDDLKTKVNEFFKSSFGFELFEAKKETKKELDTLSYETTFSNMFTKLAEYGFDSALITDYKTKLENFVKEPANSSAKDQMFKDFQEIVANIKPEDKDIIKAIQDKELSDFKDSPLSPFEIVAVARKHKIPVSYLLTFMRNDSGYGTAGIGKDTINPGNVGNTGKATHTFLTWYQGIDATGQNLAWRIVQYKNVYGDKLPKVSELAENKGPDNKGFLDNQLNYKEDNTEKKGAYMASANGGQAVEKLLADMDTSITSKNEQYIA